MTARRRQEPKRRSKRKPKVLHPIPRSPDEVPRLPVPATADDTHPTVKLKRLMAEAHLKSAEMGVHQAALTVLTQIMMGKDADGKSIASNARDRGHAAAAILKSFRDTLALDKADVAFTGPTVIVNQMSRVPDDRTLLAALEILREQGVLPDADPGSGAAALVRAPHAVAEADGVPPPEST